MQLTLSPPQGLNQLYFCRKKEKLFNESSFGREEKEFVPYVSCTGSPALRAGDALHTSVTNEMD